jgi:hypothetical protein
MHFTAYKNSPPPFSTTEIPVLNPGYFCGLRFFAVFFYITRIKSFVSSSYFDGWRSAASGYHQSSGPKPIKSHGHTRLEPLIACGPGIQKISIGAIVTYNNST